MDHGITVKTLPSKVSTAFLTSMVMEIAPVSTPLPVVPPDIAAIMPQIAVVGPQVTLIPPNVPAIALRVAIFTLAEIAPQVPPIPS